MIATANCRTVVCLLLAISLVACSSKRELSQEEIKEIASLHGELDSLSAQIRAAQIESDQYSGGLLKSLIELRVQVIKLTHSLVQQRIASIETGAPIRDTVLMAQPDSSLVRQLDEEIAKQQIEIRAARIAAEGYSGLLGALKETRVISEENTLAFLKQRRVMARFGMPLPGIPSSSAASNSKGADVSSQTKTATVPPSAPSAPKKLLEIVDVDSRVTESNSTWHKHAWKLTLRNLSQEPIACDAKIEFQDSDGFVVDDDTEYNLVVPANQSKTFTGYALITASAALRVANVNAKVSIR